MELMPQSVELLSGIYSKKESEVYMLLSFFAGIGLIALIDRLVPADENPHEIHTDKEFGQSAPLKRTGILMALAIGVHNFPEGLATFASALTNIDIALPIVFAIAIHNIPEGIAVSIPVYYATGDRAKAFRLSLLSGLAEPLGALAGYFILMPFWNNTIEGALMGITAGIMVYISLDELLPAAHEYGEHHVAIWGVIVGMAVMGM